MIGSSASRTGPRDVVGVAEGARIDDDGDAGVTLARAATATEVQSSPTALEVVSEV